MAAVADFNGAGNRDLVFVNSADNTFSVLRTSHFALRTVYCLSKKFRNFTMLCPPKAALHYR
jgi:hypothetical protein